jgi:hypothetical protein
MHTYKTTEAERERRMHTYKTTERERETYAHLQNYRERERDACTPTKLQRERERDACTPYLLLAAVQQGPAVLVVDLLLLCFLCCFLFLGSRRFALLERREILRHKAKVAARKVAYVDLL